MSEVNETRIIVCGGTSFDDYVFLASTLDEIIRAYDNVRLVSGNARGVDSIAEIYAEDRNLPIEIFPAELRKYGTKAYIYCNNEMLDYARKGRPVVVAFWNGVGYETEDLLKKARNAGVRRHVFMYGEKEGKA